MGMPFRGVDRQHYSDKLTDRRDPIVRGGSLRAEHVWTPFSVLGLGWENSTGQDGLQPRRACSGSPQKSLPMHVKFHLAWRGASSTTGMVVSADREHQSSGITVIQGPAWWRWLSSLGTTGGVDKDGKKRRRGTLAGRDTELSWGHVELEVLVELPTLVPSRQVGASNWGLEMGLWNLEEKSGIESSTKRWLWWWWELVRFLRSKQRKQAKENHGQGKYSKDLLHPWSISLSIKGIFYFMCNENSSILLLVVFKINDSEGILAQHKKC